MLERQGSAFLPIWATRLLLSKPSDVAAWRVRIRTAEVSAYCNAVFTLVACSNKPLPGHAASSMSRSPVRKYRSFSCSIVACMIGLVVLFQEALPRSSAASLATRGTKPWINQIQLTSNARAPRRFKWVA